MADLAEHNYHEHSGGASKQGYNTVPTIQMVTIQGYDEQQKHDHISSIRRSPEQHDYKGAAI